MQVTLEAITPNPLRVIERAARVCHATLDKEGTNPNFIPALLRLGHYGILEHVSVSFFIKDVSRAMANQFVRHRHLSFCQESQRHVDYSKGISYIVPDKIKFNDEALQEYREAMGQDILLYNELLKLGVPKEDARSVLPVCTATTLYVTGNARGWLEFFKQRLDNPAQEEIKEMALAIWKILAAEIPVVFNRKVLENEIPRNFSILDEGNI